MPKLKREWRERTDDWQQVKQSTLWPEQGAYEMIQAIVLYGQTSSQRAKETGANERTLDRKADCFMASGMTSLISLATFRSADEDRRELPPPRGETSDKFPLFPPDEVAPGCSKSGQLRSCDRFPLQVPSRENIPGVFRHLSIRFRLVVQPGWTYHPTPRQ